MLRTAWHFCRYWGYSSEQNKVLALLQLGARERQKKSQSVKFIVISWYVSGERRRATVLEGATCLEGDTQVQTSKVREGSESGKYLERVPKQGYSKCKDWKVGRVGLFQNQHGGWCGWRRLSEGSLVGGVASSVEGLPGHGEDVYPEIVASAGV